MANVMPFECMGCQRCCFWPSWLYWPCTIYQLISKDGHYPCAMLQYISPTSHWMRSPGANFRAGFYPCHKYILYQSTLFKIAPIDLHLIFKKSSWTKPDFLSIMNLIFAGYKPPVDMYLIFEKSSLTNWIFKANVSQENWVLYHVLRQFSPVFL